MPTAPPSRVTNAKVASLEPRWARFRGFSILFDNPGPSLTAAGDVPRLHGDCENQPELALYGALLSGLRSLLEDPSTAPWELCPLPSPSYHVTAWDGINDGNIGRVVPGHRAALSAMLEALPDPIRALPACAAFTLRSHLLDPAAVDVRFRFDRLSVWNDQALVVRLRPADEAASRWLQHMGRARDELNRASTRELSVAAGRIYSPHVTLGYFAHREGGALARGALSRWSEAIGKEAGDRTIWFRSAGLYGFTDMATFFRARRP